MQKILVTGNQGYIGSVLCDRLSKNHLIDGFDSGYFSNDLIDKKFKDNVNYQYSQDIRKIDFDILKNYDFVIHLSALSNDPIGEFNEDLTYKINFEASVELFKKCIENNVKNFIFISTQSIYGFSDTNTEIDESSENINPITAYAKSKWLVEKEIFKYTDRIQVCSLRPSTIFGYSPRFRRDIVLNNLVSNSFLNNNLEIHSDGSPWRPVLHIKDLCDCVNACLLNMKKINGNAFNLGLENGNYQVKDIADKVSKAFNNLKPNFTNSHKDPRSYRVSFNKYSKFLGQYFLPFRSIEFGIFELIDQFHRLEYHKNTDVNCFRLDYLKNSIKNNLLNNNLETINEI